jgi:predicted anti-sigma-YlaC factor YlaD
MSAIGAPSVCRRVRAQVSLRLDGELSQLEVRMLDVHLGRCADCREYAADVERFTAQLRAAPLETLASPAFVERGRRRLAHARLQGGAVAAAMAIVVIGVAHVTSSGQSDTELQNVGSTITQFPTQAELDRELAIFENLHTRRTAAAGISTL